MTALIETMRARGGVVPLLWFHRARMERSAAALGLPMPTFWGEAEARASEVGDGIVRVAWNGVAEWSTRAVPDGPMHLRTSAVVHEAYPHKTTHRDVFTRARQAAAPDEPLLVTAEGLVAECARFALVWWDGEMLCGVDEALGVLPSIGLERLGRVWPVARRRVRRDVLTGFPLAVVNAVRGLVPVAALDGVSRDPDARWSQLAASFWPA